LVSFTEILPQGEAVFEHVLLLNASFEPLNIINWKRAVKLLFLGKVEVVEESAFEVHAVSTSMRVPSIVRLIRYIGLNKREVKFSRENIYARDRFKCQYCGKRFKPQMLTYDHIIPKSRGGKTEWGNIVTCCSQCNRRKGGKTPEEAGLRLIKKPSKPSWLWGFHSRFAVHNPPTSWREYLFWSAELID
jgi:5-methylcytosine-specific restriction endonuclease McrA